MSIAVFLYSYPDLASDAGRASRSFPNQRERLDSGCFRLVGLAFQAWRKTFSLLIGDDKLY
jgi:hypothetical protein